MAKINIGVLISGGGTNLQALIDSVEQNEINGKIVVVLSNRRSAFGLQRATNHGIDNFFVSKKEAGSSERYHQRLVEIFESYKVDLVVLAGYMSILDSKFIATYRNRIINIHPALIPSFCGMGFYGDKVHKAALDYGVRVTGATVHFVDEEADTGPIILQKALNINMDDTPESLQKRVLKIEHELLPLAVRLFCENKLQIIENEGTRPQVVVLE